MGLVEYCFCAITGRFRPVNEVSKQLLGKSQYGFCNILKISILEVGMYAFSILLVC